jgi:multicomponent Na+:H+ antiporter subunit E
VNRIASFVTLTVALFVFWVGLSDQYTPLFLGMGAAAAVLVSALTHDLVATAVGAGREPLRTAPLRLWRYTSYLAWLLVKMMSASVQVAYYVLHPRMPLDPATVRFSTQLESRLARTMVANTITLIPGTLTVDLVDDEYVVHTFVPSSADDLVSGELQRRIGAIFLEDPPPPERIEWYPPRGRAP